MTGSLSIFLKVCPACAAQVPTASDRCTCGHVFESSGANELTPEEQALRDEELYENYLLARAEQAREAARAAHDALMEDPESGDKAAAAELAREVARSIESDLAEQRSKVEALRRAIEAKRPKPVVPAPAPTPAAVASPLPPAPASPPAKLAPEIVVKPAAVQPTATAPGPLKAPRPAPHLATPAAVAEKAAHVLNAIKQAKAREAAARVHKQHKAPPKMATAPVPAAETDVKVSLVPPPSFRQEQAARAEQVMETINRGDTKDCPNCTARVPVNTTRCGCGFTFLPGGNDLPSLTLCTGDFTALRNSLNLDLRRR